MSAEARPYTGEWASCDGHCDGEVRATKPDGPWPGMVLVEISDVGGNVGMTLTTDDARALAAHIEAAANSADWWMRWTRARLRAPSSDGSEVSGRGGGLGE